MAATATKQAQALVSRAVIWAGLAFGTAVTVLAVMNGIRIPRLEVVLSVAATWALLTVLAVAVVELLRRHHRAIGRNAVRYGKRGALATAGHARRHGGGALRWLVSRAAPRWENREHRPLMFRKLDGEPEGPPAETEGSEGSHPDGHTYSWGPEASPSGWPTDDLDHATTWARRMSSDRKPYVVTEYPPGGGPGRTVATYVNGKPAPDHTNTDGGTTSMTVSKIAPERRARRTAAAASGGVPSEWGPVVAQAVDFEPESDGDLLDWMAGQVTGMAAYAEGLIEAYETGVGTVGIDPKGLAALHDVADAAAHAAETMSGARAKFAEHYELPREFAANGGLMTHDGRWVTGEGA
jgi:hypothetical protein